MLLLPTAVGLAVFSPVGGLVTGLCDALNETGWRACRREWRAR